MNTSERIIHFDCEGVPLIGLLTEPDVPAAIGVLVVAGGPQYRVGSHRQFVLLARHLAAAGVPAMRFDYRGMGDSPGAARTFEDTGPDIAAAIDAMLVASRGMEKVVLWGLCDAASALLAYWQERRDVRVTGMVLLNPWVRSERSGARTRIKHYYARRLFDPTFWSKLVRGEVRIGEAVGGVKSSLALMGARGGNAGQPPADAFQDRMADGWRSFEGSLLLVLSGRDFTAKEFLDYAQSDPRWAGLLERDNVARCDLPDADHTFSVAGSREEVETRTLEWLRRLAQPRGP